MRAQDEAVRLRQGEGGDVTDIERIVRMTIAHSALVRQSRYMYRVPSWLASMPLSATMLQRSVLRDWYAYWQPGGLSQRARGGIS